MLPASVIADDVQTCKCIGLREANCFNLGQDLVLILDFFLFSLHQFASVETETL